MPTQPSVLDLARDLGSLLLKQQKKLTTAESCTGGALSAAITEIPGSSNWFERGFITYSNQAKMDCLKVPSTLLTEYGAVSEPVAEAMAQGALHHSQADISVAITGIAGPEGGTAEKPVGTVCIAIAQKHSNTQVWLKHFTGNRTEIRNQAVQHVLLKLLDLL